MSDWQPIETAPRDGTKFLVVEEDGEMTVCNYFTGGDADGILREAYMGYPLQSTDVGEPKGRLLWMPLPPLPDAH